jgi:Protein of unknown function (DUF3732)/AAA domain
MRAFVRHIGVIDLHDKVHSVAFTPGVNVITGRSSTGKSALIEIFDFCFGSSEFTVPEGIITRYADIYFVMMRVRDTDLILGRRRDEKKAFLKVENDGKFLKDISGLSVDYFEKSYFSSLEDFKIELAGWFGLTITDMDESLEERKYRGNRKKPTPSVRSFTSFMLQHQNLVANKHAIFYRFDEKLKREQVIDHFKVFMGFADQKYFLTSQKINQLKLTQKSLEQQIPRAAQLKERYLNTLKESVDSYAAISGTTLEIGDLAKAVAKPQAALDYIRLLKVDVVAESDNHAKMRQGLEEEKAKLIGDLRKNQNRLSSIRSSIKFSKSYADGAAGVLLPDDAVISVSSCPFCDVHDSALVEEANKLSDAIDWLNGELSRSKYMLSSFEEEEAKVLRELAQKKEEIGTIEKRIASLDLQTAQLQKYRSQYELALKVKLKIETILEDLLDKPDQKLQAQLDKVIDDIKTLRKFLKSNYDIEEKLKAAEEEICAYMEALGSSFEFEKSYQPIKLRFSLDTFDLWHEGADRKVFLRSMGSGANWLYCHLTLFLALHRYFCGLGDSCNIPSVLFLDQPSQVYFPSVLDTGDRFSPEVLASKTGGDRSRTVDEDVEAVTNLYSQLVEFCKAAKEDTGIEPQIIVTDHADYLEIDGDRTFDSLVAGRRWRGSGDGFIRGIETTYSDGATGGPSDLTFEEILRFDVPGIVAHIEQFAHERAGGLVDEDPLAGLIANTRASFWGVDTLEVDVSSIEVSPYEIRCTADIQFAGDQDLDSGPAGTIICGTITIILSSDLTIRFEDPAFEIRDLMGDDDE